MISAIRSALGRIVQFVSRQKRNYRVEMVRSAANSSLFSLTNQYASIYAVGLGANTLQLGAINSIGSASSVLVSLLVGWLMDRHGIKRFQMLAAVLMGAQALTCALAGDWKALVLASVFSAVSTRLAVTGASVIDADSVQNRDRVTAQGLLSTVASSVSMVAPLIAAYLVTAFGGIGVEGIRPLHYVRVVGYVLVFAIVASQLREPDRRQLLAPKSSADLIRSFAQLFEGRPLLRRWLVVSSLNWLPLALTWPFFALYAHEIRAADQYVLGAMSAAAIATGILFGVPLGRLADKIGRKRVIYWLTPLWYASVPLLIFVPSATALILAAALRAFWDITSGVMGAMNLELMPLDQQGRWSGVLGLFKSLVFVVGPLVGGLIWRELGPVYVFVVPVVLDLLIKIPLLTAVSETLHRASPGEMEASR